ncbi:MFS transporter [Nocardioides sp.]|uniref:MFS transporter n=1 Tax=Nocardioides sp. TaxID=35761 RepID=UPI002D7E7BB9|nr:MFS transporter [Nocardioides sp.]HET8958971.1 MFS transporter [Nocardioides sp.]
MSSSAPAAIRMGTPTGRAIVAAATLGTGMTLLDTTVVNVALRTIGRDLGATLSELQWITNGYLLSLASLILFGGWLGDRFGRRRMFVLGTLAFAGASLLCGLAPTPVVLIAARILQGAGAALLTPGSLAMMQGAFRPADRPRAIGTWSGLAAIAAAVGPFVGGILVDYASWRWIFLINLPIAAITIWIAVRWVPESQDRAGCGRVDIAGAVLASLALAGLTYGLIQWGDSLAPVALVVGLSASAAFVVAESRHPDPMLPLGLFRSRTFSSANVMTLLVYAALGAVTFFVVLQLQTVSGYTALAAGVALLPLTICMVLLASRGGALGARIGPRLPMTLGPIVMGAGTMLLRGIGGEVDYWRDVLPGVTVFGLGLALMVAPLTATVLAAAPDRNAGVASGVSNAVARIGSLLAVAVLPVAAGLSGVDYADPVAFDAGYRAAMVACAGMLVVGGLVSWLTIRNDVLEAAA